MLPALGASVRPNSAGVSPSGAQGCEFARKRGLRVDAPAQRLARRVEPARMAKPRRNCAELRFGRRLRLAVERFPRARNRAVGPQAAEVVVPGRQRDILFAGVERRISAARPPAMRAAAVVQPAGVSITGRDGRKARHALRRGGQRTPARDASLFVEGASMGTSRRHGREASPRGRGLSALVVAPTCGGAVEENAAGKEEAGGNALKSRSRRNVELVARVVSPASRCAVYPQTAKVPLARRDLRDSAAGQRRRRWDGSGGRRKGCRRSRRSGRRRGYCRRGRGSGSRRWSWSWSKRSGGSRGRRRCGRWGGSWGKRGSRSSRWRGRWSRRRRGGGSRDGARCSGYGGEAERNDEQPRTQGKTVSGHEPSRSRFSQRRQFIHEVSV